MRLSRLLGIVSTLTLWGCSGSEDVDGAAGTDGASSSNTPSPGTDFGEDWTPGDDSSGEPDARPSPASDGTADAPPPPLEPRIQAVGPVGAAPVQVVVHAGQPFFQSVQTLSEKNVLELSPPVDGQLERLDEETLAFVPTSGFAPGTAYTVTLRSLDNGQVVQEGEWSHRFTTPDFGLVRASLHSRDMKGNTAQVALRFSAPVSVEAVQSRTQLTVNGEALSVNASPGERAEMVLLEFKTVPEWGEDAAVTVVLDEGVPWSGDEQVTAASARQEVPLRLGPPVEVLAARLKEGMSGFYLDVVCRDEAAGAERYYWDDDTWDGWWVTARCMLSEDQMASMVRVTPAVDLTVAPAEGGFRLFGDFPQGEYALEIDAGTRTVDGGVLMEALSQRFTVGPRSPRVQFASQGRYLPRQSWDQLAIRHLNLDSATLTVRHIPQQNLVFWMSGDSERATERTSNVVFRDDVALDSQMDTEVTSWLNVGELLPDVGRGVYELTLEGNGSTDHARLMLTDLQLIAKRGLRPDGGESVWAWVLDAHNGAPIQDVDVSMVLPSGRALASCDTPLDGGCRLDIPEDALDEATPIALFARRGEDMTYLKFADLEVTPESDVTGLPYGGEAAYHAALMAERGVYRPGETVHLSLIARDETHRAPEQALPIVLSVYDARGRSIRRVQRTTNAVGMLTEDLALSDFAVTGRYRVEASAGGEPLGEMTFRVEEFVPERMAATVEILGAGARPDTAAPVEVAARWLFGGSAVGSRVELTCLAESATFVPEQNAAYHYGPASLEDAPRPVVIGVVEGMLGEDGSAGLSCPPASTSGASLGAGRLVARAAVFEGDSGRSTVETATAPLHPEAYYLGLRANVETLGAGQSATIDGIVVDWSGAPEDVTETVSAEILLLEEEIGWIWDENTGSSIRRRQLRRVREGSLDVSVEGGRFSVPFTPSADAAGYLVVVRHGNAETELHIPGEGRRYWWESGSNYADQTPRPERPTPLDLTLPDEIQVGQEVTVSTLAPYDGRLLWAVETDGVLHAEWVPVRAGSASWSFTLSEFEPNVYVSALLVKNAHLESDEAYIPSRAFGIDSVRVRPAPYLHTVSLEVPELVQPNSPLTVGLRVEGASGPTYATVAAVDEGILQLTDFDSPDPALQIFAQRALGVDTYETVGWSLANSGGPGSRTGGDAGEDGGRVQMVKPVSLWSGLVDVGEDGYAEVELSVPSYRGELRVMAVTASAQRIGSASAAVTVRDPLVLQTTLPRFLTEGDHADIPVFLTNMTGAAGEFSVALDIEDIPMPGMEIDSLIPPLSLEGEATRTVALAEGESASVVFQAIVNRAPSAGRVTVRATGNGETSTDTLEIPITSALPELRTMTRIPVSEAEALSLKPYFADWLPGSDRSTVWLSANPYGSAFSHMSYLIRYPYGCIEQTTSSVRPLLYVSSLLENVDPNLLEDGSVDEKIQHGIERVASMQTAEGGFAYWPGGTRPSLWPTAYATHMLLEANSQGRSLPDGLLDGALDWLASTVEGSSNTRGAAYAHYVLSMADRPRTANAEQRLQSLSEDQQESRLLLMAAIQRAGVRTYEDVLKQPDLSTVKDERDNDWAFYSDRRRRALNLSVMEDLFPGDPAGEALAALVADTIDDRPSAWYTTQELAWAISGLGKRVQGMNAVLPELTLTADQSVLEPRRQGPQGTSWRLVSTSRYENLLLSIPASEQPLYLHVMTDGIAETPAAAPSGGEGLSVSRIYRTGSGQPFDPTRHNLGDLVYVQVSIQNTGSRSVQNVALVDRIPAGWEIENPRLGRGDLPDWASELPLWDRDHMNLRDDRLEVFGDLPDSEKRVVIYAVRAVTAGTFQQPPVSAEAMYDPRIWARQPGVEVEIIGPWATAL